MSLKHGVHFIPTAHLSLDQTLKLFHSRMWLVDSVLDGTDTE